MAERQNTQRILRDFTALRVCQILTFAILAWFSLAQAIAGATQHKNHTIALKFWSGNSDALARKADAALLQAKSPEQLYAVGRISREALVDRPLNPLAIRILGYVADGTAQQKKANQLIELASSLSRRDLGTQLWLIENRIQREDLRGSLENYDIALRTSADGRKLLFPILVNGLEDLSIRAEFARYVRQNPPWLSDFFGQAIASGKRPDIIAQTIVGAGGLPPGKAFRDLDTQMISHLASAREFATLEDYYRHLRGVSLESLRSLSFDRASIDPHFAPVTWELFQSSGLVSSFDIEPNRKRAVMHVIADSGSLGTVARKVLFMPSGRYSIAVRNHMHDVANDAYMRLVLECWGTERLSSAAFEIPMNADSGRHRFFFDVPEHCPTQILLVTVAGGIRLQGVDFSIDGFDLQREE